MVKRGFTLIELLVSVAIITFITAVALVQHSQFNSTIALTNLAYEVALSIREAQTYGVSAREIVNNQDTNFGVHITMTDPDQYVLFADIGGEENTYDESLPGNSTELVLGFDITQGNQIERFCVTKSSFGTDCSSDLNGPDVLDVLFARPNPDARVYADGDQYDSAMIYIVSRRGDRRCVAIEQTGQISVINDPSICTAP